LLPTKKLLFGRSTGVQNLSIEIGRARSHFKAFDLNLKMRPYI